jgi:hypothetical protein
VVTATESLPFLSELSHVRLDGERPVAILSLSVLKSLDRARLDSLAQIGIRTLSELLHFEPIHRARVVLAATRGELGHDINLDPYLDNVPADLTGIVDLPVEAIKGVGRPTGTVLRDRFFVRTIRELAEFRPIQEAEALVAEQTRAFSELSSAPDELIPRARGAATATRTRYSSFVRETTPRLGLRLQVADDVPDFVNKSLLKLFVGDAKRDGTKFNPDLGYALLHQQTWWPMGLQLGEPLHSVGLSPGEVRKVAVIDWRQSLRASRAEDTKSAEQLNSLLLHQRALDEVVRTTAEEHQAGRTDTIAATGVGAGAGVASGAMIGAIGGAIVGGVTGVPIGALLGLAAGALGGGGAAGAPTGGAAAPEGAVAGAAAGVPVGAALGGLGGTLTGALMGSALGAAAAAIGGSLLASASGALGHIESSSKGDRGIFGRLNQNITDVTTQKSSLVRSLRSSVVIDVSQQEQEQLTTYVIANNNRAHALSIVYFELLNRYRVEMSTAGVEPLIFIPFFPLNFDFDLIAAYWHVIRLGVTDPGLVAAVDELLSSVDFFEGGIDIQVAGDSAAKLTELAVDLLVPPALVDPTSFHIDVLTNAGGISSLGDGRLLQTTSAGVAFRFSKDLNLDLSTVNTIRVRSGLAAGRVRLSLRISRMKVHTNAGDQVIRNIPLPKVTLDTQTNSSKELDFPARDLVETRRTAQQDLGVIVDRIIDHVRRRAYFFTRFVLLGVDAAEVEDLLEALIIQGADGVSPIRLITLIDPTPVGFVGGYVVFPLKREPSLFKIYQLRPQGPIHLPAGILGQMFPKLDLSKLPAVRNQLGIVDELRPLLDFLDEIVDREAKERAAGAVVREIALPTSGIFAEAILGRSVAAEKIDVTRYIAWDLANPNQPPNIADVKAGDRGQSIPPLNATIENGVLQIQPPTPLPDPTGFAGAFNALASGTLFRDMSKSDVLGQTLASLANVAQSAAQQAGTLAGQAQQAALQAATGLAQEVAKGLSTVAGSAFGSLTELGGKLNAGIPPTPTSTPTPTPPTPTPTPPTPTPTPPTPTLRNVEILLRVFVPSEIWAAEPTLIAPGSAALAVLRFNGDSRDFGQDTQKTSRINIPISLKLDAVAMKVVDLDASRAFFGKAEIYLATDAEDVSNRPKWFKKKKGGATPITGMTGQLLPDGNNIKVEHRSEGNNATITINIAAKPQFPFLSDASTDFAGTGTVTVPVDGVPVPLPLKTILDILIETVRVSGGSFDIDASVGITFSRRADGEIQYQLSGTHDGFPAYEIYVNGDEAYKFMPQGNDAPDKLIPPNDENIPDNISPERQTLILRKI